MADRRICTCMLMSSSIASELEHLSYAIQKKDNDDIEETVDRVANIFNLIYDYCGIESDRLVEMLLAIKTLAIEGEYSESLNGLVMLRTEYDEVLDKCE